MAEAQQDRYVLQRKLGSGGMGTVWLATDTLLNRPVAIKYLRTMQDIYREMFLSEARMLASLNHPNITQIYDAVFDEQAKRFYLVMEYVEGMSLSNMIAESSEPLPFEFVLEVAVGVLHALQYAHDRSIVHRDIKPENVIIQGKQVKLTDFGVASLMSLLAEGSDYIVGTPAYISPEQIEGITVDGRADLYSLGVMLFEMASGGQLPFAEGGVTQLYQAHLETPPDSLRAVAPGIPLAFDRVVLRLMAKNPDERYTSAQAALDVVSSIQARQKFSQSHLRLLDPEAKPLVGRADELELLGAKWTECRESARPRLVVVHGVAGIGKSRLVTEFLGRVVDQGFGVLVGRGGESGVPYAPYAEILATILNKGLTQSVVTQNQIDQLLNHIPSLARLLNLPDEPAVDAEAEEISQLVPGVNLWQTLGDKIDITPSKPSPTQWQFFDTVLAILTDLGPTVLYLEDATALDEASVPLTRFLIEQGQLPLLLIAACRDDSQEARWFDPFSTEEKTVMTLLPLSTAATKDFVTNVVGGAVPAEAVQVIGRRSRGNPFQIEEITRQLIEAKELYQAEQGTWQFIPPPKIAEPDDTFLPKSVFNVFSRRIEELPASSREALAVAALIESGPEFDFDTWLALLGGESQLEFAQQLLHEAQKKRLVRQLGDRQYAFRPAEVATALVSSLPEDKQHELHQQVAQLLHQNHADPILVATHYEQAGLVNEATSYLEQAGTKAMSTNAVNAAIAYYDRATTLAESQSSYKALGNLYRVNGELTKSIQAFEKALKLAIASDDVDEQAQVLNGLSYSLWLCDRYKEAYQRAAAVLKLTGVSSAERAMAQSNLGMVSWLVGRLPEAEAWCVKAVQAADEPGDEASLSTAQYRLGLVYFSQTKLAEAESAFQQALSLRRELVWEWGQGHCLAKLGKVAAERGDFDQASAHFDSAQQLFEKINSRRGLMVVYTNRGQMLLYRRQPAEALSWLTKALPLALKARRNAYLLSDIYRLIAQVSLQQNKLDRAKAAAEDALKLVEAVGNQEYVAAAQATLAQICAAQGDPSAAETMYQKALTLFKQVGQQAGWLRTQLNYAQFLAAQGQGEQATSLEQEAQAEAARWGVRLEML